MSLTDHSFYIRIIFFPLHAWFADNLSPPAVNKTHICTENYVHKDVFSPLFYTQCFGHRGSSKWSQTRRVEGARGWGLLYLVTDKVHFSTAKWFESGGVGRGRGVRGGGGVEPRSVPTFFSRRDSAGRKGRERSGRQIRRVGETSFKEH